MNNEEKILQMLSEMQNEQKATNERLSKLEQGQVKLEQRTLKTEMSIENIIIPQLKILAEGHNTIQNQIKNLSVIDRMQDDIATLKTAVKFLSQELDKLQKAI